MINSDRNKSHLGHKAQSRLEAIAAASETSVGVTRLPFTDQHRQALIHIEQWMTDAGLQISLDAAGTLVGCLEGSRKNAQVLAFGSHQDSVRHGGRYDGIMGVALPCLALEKLKQEGFQPINPIEIYAFADEEGVRFPTALLGPRALAGTVDPAVLEMCDAKGVSIGEALSSFGCDPKQIPSLRRSREDMLGYLEVHIEQGPVLEKQDKSLGVVSAICGIERHTVTVTGETGHAGTMPMEGRRDALVAASQMILEINKEAQNSENIRATVGTLSVGPGAVNQVPKSVTFSLEIRAEKDADRLAFRAWAKDMIGNVAPEHGCTAKPEKSYEQTAEACDPKLMAALDEASQTIQGQTPILPSGATHDASAMADLCPIAMLFVRCRDGISHTPEEYCSDDDMDDAINALALTIKKLTS